MSSPQLRDALNKTVCAPLIASGDVGGIEFAVSNLASELGITSNDAIAAALVQTCPQSCALAYGNGNPDISGIGVLIAFILQGVYLLLFGTVASMVFISLSQRHAQQWRYDLQQLQRIARKVAETSALLTLTTTVASFIHMKQDPPEYEKLFLYRLHQYLLAVCSTSSMVFWAFFSAPNGVGKHDVAIFICDLASWNMAASFCSSGRRYDRRHPNTALVMETCASLEGFPTPVHGLVRQIGHGLDQQAQTLVWMMSTCLIVALIVTDRQRSTEKRQPRALNAAEAYPNAVKITLPWSLRHPPSESGGYRYTIIFACVFYSLHVVLKGISVIQVRSQMLHADGVNMSENQWEFGQVTAVLLWLPASLLVVTYLLKVVTSLCARLLRPFLSPILRRKFPVVRQLAVFITMLRVLIQYLILQDDIDEQFDDMRIFEEPPGSHVDLADRANEKLTKPTSNRARHDPGTDEVPVQAENHNDNKNLTMSGARQGLVASKEPEQSLQRVSTLDLWNMEPELADVDGRAYTSHLLEAGNPRLHDQAKRMEPELADADGSAQLLGQVDSRAYTSHLLESGNRKLHDQAKRIERRHSS